MRVPIFQIDAFATQRFTGNPAAVMLLPAFPPDPVLQAIAAENNLSETAFLVASDSDYTIRWFTPAVEVLLCGHATLASAAVVMQRLEPARSQVVFHSASGPLPVRRTAAGYCLNFPARPREQIELPAALVDALGVVPIEVYINTFNYLAVLANAATVRELAPDLAAIARLDRGGVIVTAAGQDRYDCVSRYFAPAKSVPEDPVTGAAHTMLAPYWAARLGKTTLRAFQASRRGGEITCTLIGDRVELEGACIFYLEGTADISL